MHCTHCGSQLSPGVEYCPNCGAKVNQWKYNHNPTPNQPYYNYPPQPSPQEEDALGCWLTFACLMVFFLGFILAEMWKHSRPNAARTARTIAIVMTVLQGAGIILSIFFGVMLPFLILSSLY